MEAKSHLVAVAYRAFGSAQQDCQDKFNAGVLKTDAEGASCIDDGLTASQLETAIETLRKQIVAVGQGGAQGCTAASQQLADVVQQEEGSIHALHADLVRLDARSFNRDFEAADADAGREAKLVRSTRSLLRIANAAPTCIGIDAVIEQRRARAALRAQYPG